LPLKQRNVQFTSSCYNPFEGVTKKGCPLYGSLRSKGKEEKKGVPSFPLPSPPEEVTPKVKEEEEGKVLRVTAFYFKDFFFF